MTSPRRFLVRVSELNSLARDCECLDRHCARRALKVHSSFCAVIPAGVVAPVDVVRHCGYQRVSNLRLCRDSEAVRKFPGISHWGGCVDDLGTSCIGNDHLNLGIRAVSGVTVRRRCCDCHCLSGLSACGTHRIGRRKTRWFISRVRGAGAGGSYQSSNQTPRRRTPATSPLSRETCQGASCTHCSPAFTEHLRKAQIRTRIVALTTGLAIICDWCPFRVPQTGTVATPIKEASLLTVTAQGNTDRMETSG